MNLFRVELEEERTQDVSVEEAHELIIYSVSIRVFVGLKIQKFCFLLRWQIGIQNGPEQSRCVTVDSGATSMFCGL
jgi:hypothetical protein